MWNLISSLRETLVDITKLNPNSGKIQSLIRTFFCFVYVKLLAVGLHLPVLRLD